MNSGALGDWFDFIRENFGELDELMPLGRTGRRLADATAETFMKQGMRILEKFVGDKEPTTPKERKKRRILEAATELFIQQGYRKTSIDEVARRAGVAKGTVYLYFKNKTELLVHAIALEKMRYVGDVMAILKQEMPARERLREYLKGAFVLVVRMPLVSKMMSGDRELLIAMEDYGMQGRFSILDMQAAFLSFLVRRAVPDSGWTADEVEARSKVLVGLMYASGFMEDERLRGGMSVDRFAGLLADMLVDGIAPPGPGRMGGDR